MSRVEVAGVEVSTEHFIGGERVGSDATFTDISPIDAEPIAEVARGGEREADLALASARDAFPGWAALGATGRAEVMHRLADLIDANVERLAAVECADMAMLLRSLRARVISRGARNFRAYGDLAVAYEERVWESNGTRNRVIRMPSGPVVVITPWNAPFMLSTWKTAPALAAGCTVVLKPAEWSPLSCSLLCDLVSEAGFPPGVFNVVQGIGEEVGAALTRHPAVRRISFTGSPETAVHIGTAAARNIVPFTGELGGKGPLLVFADADLEAAARKAAGQYDDAGQVCLAGTRLLVEESVADEFLELFHRFTADHVLGDPREDETTIAPLIHPEHLARVEGFVERARASGDEIVAGGRLRDDVGPLFYDPTLVVPRSNDSEIVQREVFGPVLTFQGFADEGEAVALANSTRYGLSGIVYTGSEERAERVGRGVRAGTLWVNTFLVRDLTAPFGGMGISGIGREGGDYALDFYSDLKTLQILEGDDDMSAIEAYASSVSVDDLDRDPYPVYARLRAVAPVCLVPAVGLWFVTRWEDVEAAATRPDVFCARVDPSPLERTMGGESILLLDGRPQKRLRAMLDPSLRPRVVEATTPDLIEPLAAELLDGLAGRGEAELMSEYFEPISVLGLGRVLGLGHLGGDTLRRWFHGLAEGAVNFEDDPAKWEVADATAAEIDRELAPVFERLYADPDGSTIATMLALAEGTLEERVATILPTLKVILLGGMQEPGHAAGSTLVGLLESRQVRAVLDDLTLVRDAVEEGLRWVSPIGTQTRRALVDAELGGVTVPAGANLGLLVSSANRDEEVWGPTADEYNLFRPNRTHAAFGFGTHYCSGHHFSRVQMRIALTRLLEHLPGLRLDPNRPPLFTGWEFRAPRHLHVLWDA